MINEKAVRKAFGTKIKACKQITCSRPQLNQWISQGYIPEISTNGPKAGTQWWAIIRKLGFDENLKPL